MAPRQNIQLREIMYQLSPYQQSVIGQAFKNAPKTFMHFLQQRSPGLIIFGLAYYGGVWWTENEIHKERMKERF
ncbi:ubiquinol:cytochrome c oxidoreductase 9 kDa subunit [Dunaliella salina]|uniref:Ubiquinol:cytochrome c oxidoreductase 9 kDa subunit n=1 Tax=Dunaliella salina TaxID=3046 RepID=A0ABQ7H7Z1_DUNSA|nr:ubiquinol:cytochrome c oxidoreductase 9 kDa subunit [Dunaliella salina]|eukprot:KAF5842968.1 ubiquinol:cytochrome c oxidoreductase 9 kDa subunit [Dunaliella salina]